MTVVTPERDQTDLSLDDLSKMVIDGFAKVDERFDRVDERFDRVDERFEKVDARFEKVEDNVKEGLARVDSKITQLMLGLLAGAVVIIAALIGLAAVLIQISSQPS